MRIKVFIIKDFPSQNGSSVTISVRIPVLGEFSPSDKKNYFTLILYSNAIFEVLQHYGHFIVNNSCVWLNPAIEDTIFSHIIKFIIKSI